MTPDFVNGILKDITKTLRVMVSLAGQPYDILGLSCCLMAQIRHTVSCAMICSEGMWDVELPSKLWDFFLVQFLEIAKFTTFEFERFPLPGKSEM